MYLNTEPFKILPKKVYVPAWISSMYLKDTPRNKYLDNVSYTDTLTFRSILARAKKVEVQLGHVAMFKQDFSTFDRFAPCKNDRTFNFINSIFKTHCYFHVFRDCCLKFMCSYSLAFFSNLHNFTCFRVILHFRVSGSVI